MGLLRFCLAALLLLAAMLKVTTAQAAGTLTLGAVNWVEGREDRLAKQINREDCVNNNTLDIGYTYSGAQGYVFELWAGAGCDQAGARTGSGSVRTCVQVGTASLSNRAVEVKAADLVKDISVTTFPADTATACNPTTAVSGFENRVLFLVIYDPSSMAAVATAQWQYSFDIVGPAAPTSVTASPGDTTVITSFTGTTDTDAQKYEFFCAPALGITPTAGSAGMDAGGTAGAAGTAGAGGSAGIAGTDTGGATTAGTAGTDTGGVTTAGTAGTDTGGVSGSAGIAGTAGTSGTAGTAGGPAVNPDCMATALTPGVAPGTGAMACGTIGSQGSNGGETDPDLTNGIVWAVGVASVDQAGNVGPLSNLACTVPKDTVGFYEAYRKAGGEAGGGFCTFSPGVHGTLASLLDFLGLGAIAAWRRRR
jgi:hypothetical protein